MLCTATPNPYCDRKVNRFIRKFAVNEAFKLVKVLIPNGSDAVNGRFAAMALVTPVWSYSLAVLSHPSVQIAHSMHQRAEASQERRCHATSTTGTEGVAGSDRPSRSPTRNWA